MSSPSEHGIYEQDINMPVAAFDEIQISDSNVTCDMNIQADLCTPWKNFQYSEKKIRILHKFSVLEFF